MIVQMQYAGRSGILNSVHDSRVAFATNKLRETTFLRGSIKKPLLLREALAALYQVVVSDFKYRPKDRLAFQTWLEEQDRLFLANLGLKSARAWERLEELQTRLDELNGLRADRLKPFHKARLQYFQYVYENQYELQLILDPVITIHPDELSFEAFSRDESTYARVSASYDLFGQVSELECGTTNIDFSTRLHAELERMRSYRSTNFEVDPGGFSVVSSDAVVREKKIDLPESWVQGFHQVHSTMTLGLTHLRLAPVDLYNLCRALRRRKARSSPRSLRFELTPGKTSRMVLEPWEQVIDITGSSPYQGNKALSIRTWGRDRLRTIARLIPITKHVDVYLAGKGLPSIYVVDLGELRFTLALSGWTDNDWTGGSTRFDLLARRLEATPTEIVQVYETLRRVRFSPEATLATSTKLSTEKVRACLSYLCQVGRAMYDLGGGVFRHRDLFQSPFSVKEAAVAVRKADVPRTPQERAAREMIEQDNIRIIKRQKMSTGFKLAGSARGGFDPGRVRPEITTDDDGVILDATCTCSLFKKTGLTKGPCEHILALRLKHLERLDQEHPKEE